MSKLLDLDVVWEQVAAARAQGDTGAEARALALLEQALYDCWRGEALDRRRKEEQAARNKEPRYYERSMASMPGPGPAHLVETIIAGFLAVKVLGPFLEEWAKKRS